MGDLKIFELQNFKHNFDLTAFVETGTFRGEGTLHASHYFDQVYTIEIDEEMYNNTKNNLKHKSNIHFLLGNSADVIEELSNKINANTLFWLDAHFPGADAHKVPYNHEKDPHKRIPLENELKSIHKNRVGKYNDVLIIDDLWLYEDGPFQSGDLDAHMKKCGHNTTREKLMQGRTMDWFYDLYSPTHNIMKDYRHQGYLIVTPK